MDQDAQDHIFHLPNGRQIGYSIYGDITSQNRNIIYLHGLPGSRVEALDLAPSALHHNARLIALDRPGYGLSSLNPGRTISSYPVTDVLPLIDHLGIEAFYIVGTSGGGPYALSCARYLSKERLRGVAVIAGLSPFEHEFPFRRRNKKKIVDTNQTNGNSEQHHHHHHDDEDARHRQGRILQRYMLRYLPNFTAQLSDSKYGKLARQSHAGSTTSTSNSNNNNNNNNEALQSLFRQGFANYQGIDANLFKSEEYIKSMSNILSQAFRQGWKGYAEDGKILHRNWDFNLRDIDSIDNNILFAYGGLDSDIPPEMGRKMHKVVKGSRYIEFENETHATLIRVKGREILGDLLSCGT